MMVFALWRVKSNGEKINSVSRKGWCCIWKAVANLKRRRFKIWNEALAREVRAIIKKGRETRGGGRA